MQAAHTAVSSAATVWSVGLGPAEERTPFSHVPCSCTVPKVDVTRMCMNSDLSTTLHHTLSHEESFRVAVSEAMGQPTMAWTRPDTLGSVSPELSVKL